MSKIKRFFRQTGLTKAQLISSLLCYFLCFALFLGIVVIWNPLSLSSTPTEDTQAADGPLNTSKYWTDDDVISLGLDGGWCSPSFSGGSGTSSDPYLISSAWDLAYLSYMVYSGSGPYHEVYGDDKGYYGGVYFKQTTDISLSLFYWRPIGCTLNPLTPDEECHYFSGCYNGGGYVVSDIFTHPDEYYAGLFGAFHRGSMATQWVRNIGIEDSFIQGTYAGGIVGWLDGTCDYSFENCYNAATVSGDRAGGIVGVNYNIYGDIEFVTCYNIGTISAGEIDGGIIGDAHSPDLKISLVNCFSTTIRVASDAYAKKSYCYGPDNRSSIATDAKNFTWYTTASNWNSADPWDFENTWVLDASENDGYPNLTGYWTKKGRYDTSWYSASGGTESNPYIIDSAADLAGISYMVYSETGPHNGKYYFPGKYFQLGANINLSAYYWQPIGTENDRNNNGAERFFAGNFDGNGYYIQYIKTPDGNITAYSCQGLFGWVETYQTDITLQDIEIRYPQVYGNWHVGAVVGRAVALNNNLTIQDCTVQFGSGDFVIGRGDNVGGVVGYLYNYNTSGINTTLSNCEIYAYYSSTPRVVEGAVSVGGIVGHAQDSGPGGNFLIQNCSSDSGINISSVNSDGKAGGIVGYSDSDIDGSILINDCTNDSNVSGQSNNGGIVGLAWVNGASSEINVQDCLNTSSVSGTSNYTGGLIGRANGGGVVSIVDSRNASSVSGVSYVGGLVGACMIDTELTAALNIDDSYNSSSVTGTTNYTGGLVGYSNAQTTSITKSYNTAAISGLHYVGGLAGEIHNETSGSAVVKNCYNTGAVNATGNNVGGVVGRIYLTESSLVISNSYNTASISSPVTDTAGTDNIRIGGIIGESYPSGPNSSVRVVNSFSTGAITGRSMVGGAIGVNTGSGTHNISNTYYSGNNGTLGSSGSYLSDLATLAKTELFFSPFAGRYVSNTSWSTYWAPGEGTAWDFFTIWQIRSSYPTFRTSSETFWTDNASTSFASGNGTESSPYIISTAGQLALLSKNVAEGNTYAGVYFQQGANISLSGRLWVPIGNVFDRYANNIDNCYFAGNYDGAGYTITNMRTSILLSYQGLFGAVMGASASSPAVIENVTVSNSNINGYDYVAGIAGYAQFANFDNCMNSASVTSAGRYTGGISGQVYGDVKNCYNLGSVNSTLVSNNSYTGGIVGQSSGADRTFASCYNYGAVTGGHYTGGIIGNGGIRENIQFCNNFGDIAGSNYTGGIVGRITDNSTVSNCTVSSSVSGSYSVGGIVGEIYLGVTIEDCLVLGTLSAAGNFGGLVGQAVESATIKDSANLGSISVSSGSACGGIIGYLNVASTSSGITITNCYADFSLAVSTSLNNFGSLVGNVKENTQNSSITNCAAFLTTSGTIENRGNFFGGASSMTVQASYAIVDGSKDLTYASSAMDGNFAYISNFKDGRPIPLGIFHILDFGTTTGIANRVNAL